MADRRAARRALVALPLAVLLLAGCAAANPRADLRDRVADVIAAANDGDAGGVRSAAEALIAEVESQRAELGETEANALLDLARQVQADAGLLEQAPPPPPSPTASPTASPTPSPTPSSASPTPSRSPSRSPSPSPTTREPEPSEEPSPSEEPEPSSPGPIVSISPVASSPTSSPSPSPSSPPAQAKPSDKPGKKSPSPSPSSAR